MQRASTLAERTLEAVAEAFASQKGTPHRPSADQWSALRDLAEYLETMAQDRAAGAFKLCSLDPGVGKTQTVTHFLRALLDDPAYDDVAVLYCAARKAEIKAIVEDAKLSPEQFAVFTADREVNTLSPTPKERARVLFTTQAMVLSRCNGGAFSRAEEFHFQGRPRQVRVWDESILPGSALTVRGIDLHFLITDLAGRYLRVAKAIIEMVQAIEQVEDGSTFEIPDWEKEFGVDLNDVMGVLEERYIRKGREEWDIPADKKQIATTLWVLGGRPTVVRKEGRFGSTVLTYREELPADLAPMVILDASGRVRETYRQWQAIEPLKYAPKDYSKLTLHVWPRGGGKDAFRENGQELLDGIASTVNTKPDEEWLVIHHLPERGVPDVPAKLRDLVKGDPERVKFLSWGNHTATNEYSHIKNVILAGTLFYRPSLYEAYGRMCAEVPPGRAYPKELVKNIELGEHRHLILQALCRGAVRKSDGASCRECDAYVIASVASKISTTLPEIFPGAKIVEWRPVQRALKGKVKAAVAFIDRWFADHPEHDAALGFRVVQEALGIKDSTNFRTDIRRHKDFQAELRERGIVEGHRGRFHFFTRIEHLDAPLNAEAYGFSAAA